MIEPDVNTIEAHEDDAAKTRLEYDDGGLPWWIAAIWIGFLVAFVVILGANAWPDLVSY